MVNASQIKSYVDNLRSLRKKDVEKIFEEVKYSVLNGVVFQKEQNEARLRVRQDIEHWVNNTLCYYCDLISCYGDILLTLIGFGYWQKTFVYFNLIERSITMIPMIFLLCILSILMVPLFIIFAPLGLLVLSIVIFLSISITSTLAIFIASNYFSTQSIIKKLDTYNLKTPAQNSFGEWDQYKLIKMLGIAILIQIWKFYRYGLFHAGAKNNIGQYMRLFDNFADSIICRSFMFEITDVVRNVLTAAHHPNFRKSINNQSVHQELCNLAQ